MKDAPESYPEEELDSKVSPHQEGLFLCASMPRMSLHAGVCVLAVITVRRLGKLGRGSPGLLTLDPTFMCSGSVSFPSRWKVSLPFYREARAWRRSQIAQELEQVCSEMLESEPGGPAEFFPGSPVRCLYQYLGAAVQEGPLAG